MTKNITLALLMAFTGLAIPAASMAQAPAKLVLQLHQVYAKRETSSGIFIGRRGNDNMILGGIAVGANGKKTQIKTGKVGSFEDSGDRKRFSPAKAFATLPVSTGTAREYSVVLVLAEEDVSGGTNEFVASLLESSTSSDGGKADGGVSLVAGAVAKELAKRAVKRLQNNAKDDIFPARTVTVRLREPDRRFENGGISTPRQVVTFKGHGGLYDIVYSWKLQF
jgi:hypothetical protein